MSNIIVAIAVFLITVIGALFAVPYFVDWNGYRSVFEEEATRLLGREVRVGGAVNLHLLPTPYFRFEKVRIADASVNLQEPFFRTDSLTIKLAIPPMIRGVVEANEIELQRPILRLALDGGDGWNWQSFGQVLGKSAYLPANVSLNSVKIVDGALAVHGPDGAERTRFEGFNGEFSAPALEGPYRLRGTFGTAGAERELTHWHGAGAKATARCVSRPSCAVDAGASTYTLDGRLVDLTGKPRIEGELTARLPIAGLWQAPPRGTPGAPKKSVGTDGADKGEAAFDLRAAVRADPGGATLTDLALSFEQDGRPQLITGELKASWREALAVETSLASRWLDLDRIAGAGEGASPLDSIIPLAVGLRDLLPSESRSRATFAIDQANVGHEAVSGLRLVLTRTDDRLAIEELRLGLPGGSRGELQGVVTGPPDAPVFDGSIGLRGTSLVRFLGWATAGAVTFDPKGDGTFGVRAQLSISTGRAAARNIVADLSGTAISAEAQYRWEGRPEVTLTLEGPQLDARAFIPAGSSLGDVFDVVLHGPLMGQATTKGLGAARPGWRGAQTDAFIRVSAGQLITAARTYRDVAVEVELKGGRLRVPLLRVASDEGFSLELEGEVDDAASRPKGSVRALVSADSGRAIAPLAELLGIPEAFRPDARRAQAMVPLRLGGSMTFGVRTPTSADLSLDGETNGAGVKLSARLDGGPAGWRSGPADVTGLVEGNDAQAISALLVPSAAAGRAANAGSGRAVVKASGVPGEGMVALASMETGDLALNFRGRLTAGEDRNSAAGDLDIRATDGARIAALAGLTPPLRLDGMPMAGTLRFAIDRTSIALERLALNVAGSDVKGRLRIGSVGARRRVEASLDVDELSLARMLGLLQDQRLAVAAAAETAVSGRQSVWSDEPFDAAVLDGFEGSVKLTAKRFLVADGISLRPASLDIALQGGKIEVKQLEGGCLGGRCNATLSIAKAQAGVEVSGSLRVTGGTLESLAGNAADKRGASGTIGGTIEFAGKGIGPRSVLSVLQGSGTLQLGDARLGTLWPGAVGQAVEAALKADPDSMPAVLKRTLAAGLGGGELPLAGPFGLEIADGRLAAKAFAIDTAEGRAQGAATLDLKTLQVESDWRLEPLAAGDKAALPGVTVSYRGPVAALASLEPRINSEALERELAVRRMERDVEELERLRRLDEARRREEMERQRRQLEQAPLPGPVPVAPAVPAPRSATPG